MAVGTRMLIVVIILLLLLSLAFWSGPARPPAPGGINLLEQVTLGGVRQWIAIRAAHPRAPVLLFLHGGPGSANLAKLRLQVPELEQHFVVVSWDQPGAGKSVFPGFEYSNLSIEQMVSDAHELVISLKARFGVDKLYLLGFSWGTVIGLSLAQRYPQDFQAFISVSQVVDSAEGERLSLEFVRQEAAQAGDERAITALAGLDPAYRSPDWFQQLATERNWLLHYGGVYHTASNYSHEIWLLLKAHEYSLAEVGQWPGRSSASLKQIWPQVMQVNFFETAPAVACPIYFFVGRFDHNAPAQLTEAYYQELEAPARKHLVWFEHSAHDIFYDEPERLVQEVLGILQASIHSCPAPLPRPFSSGEGR
jgi:pimeloyl-ACP methyl ester carboxylesterase